MLSSSLKRLTIHRHILKLMLHRSNSIRPVTSNHQRLGTPTLVSNTLLHRSTSSHPLVQLLLSTSSRLPLLNLQHTILTHSRLLSGLPILLQLQRLLLRHPLQLRLHLRMPLQLLHLSTPNHLPIRTLKYPQQLLSSSIRTHQLILILKLLQQQLSSITLLHLPTLMHKLLPKPLPTHLHKHLLRHPLKRQHRHHPSTTLRHQLSNSTDKLRLATQGINFLITDVFKTSTFKI